MIFGSKRRIVLIAATLEICPSRWLTHGNGFFLPEFTILREQKFPTSKMKSWKSAALERRKEYLEVLNQRIPIIIRSQLTAYQFEKCFIFYIFRVFLSRNPYRQNGNGEYGPNTCEFDKYDGTSELMKSVLLGLTTGKWSMVSFRYPV
jgi:hypothetical protein